MRAFRVRSSRLLSLHVVKPGGRLVFEVKLGKSKSRSLHYGKSMQRAVAQLILFLAAFLLSGINTFASLPPPSPLDLTELKSETSADFANTPQLTWADLEAENAVLAVLLLPAYPYDDTFVVVVILQPDEIRKVAYWIFLHVQLPLGLYWGQSGLEIWWHTATGTWRTTGKVLRECPDAAKDAAAALVKEVAVSSANCYYAVTGSSKFNDESIAFRYFYSDAIAGVSAGDSLKAAAADGLAAAVKAPVRAGERITNGAYEFAETGNDEALVHAEAAVVGPVVVFSAMGAAVRPTRVLAGADSRPQVTTDASGSGTQRITNKLPVSTDGKLMGEISGGRVVMEGNINPTGEFDFIVKVDGGVLLGRKHSFLSSGTEVQASGTLKLRNGKIVNVTNASGHYMPTVNEAGNFLRILKEAGADIDSATLQIFGPNGTTVKQIPPNAGTRSLFE